MTRDPGAAKKGERGLIHSSRETMNMLMCFRNRILHILHDILHISSSSSCHWWETSDSLRRLLPETGCNQKHKHMISFTMLKHFTGSHFFAVTWVCPHIVIISGVIRLCVTMSYIWTLNSIRVKHTQQRLWPVDSGFLRIDGLRVTIIHTALIVRLRAHVLQLHTVHVYSREEGFSLREKNWKHNQRSLVRAEIYIKNLANNKYVPNTFPLSYLRKRYFWMFSEQFFFYK